MSRPLRINYPGAFYHVTTRGNARQNIFFDDSDRRLFLKCVGRVAKDCNLVVHAYCLMGNHYHVLVETPDGNLPECMRQLNGIYTQKFNWRHDRVGHVFQGRYKAVLVEKDSYLLAVSRYVVLNPVRSGIVRRPGDWQWSSYMKTAGEKAVPEWLETGGILGLFRRRDGTRAQQAYRRFITEGMSDGGRLSKVDSRKMVLGVREFIEKLRPLVRRRSILREYPRSERFVTRPALDDIFDESQGKEERNRNILRAYRACGYSMTEIGKQVGLTCSMISKIINGFDL